MNPCPEFVDRLARAAEVETDAVGDAELGRHLQACAACRGALEAQRHIRAMLAARPAVTASPEFRVRVREAVERERAWPAGIDFRRWTWRLVPIAAAAVLATWFGIAGVSNGAARDADTFGQLPVAAALYTEEVSESSMLSLMLRARADEQLGAYYESSAR